MKEEAKHSSEDSKSCLTKPNATRGSRLPLAPGRTSTDSAPGAKFSTGVKLPPTPGSEYSSDGSDNKRGTRVRGVRATSGLRGARRRGTRASAGVGRAATDNPDGRGGSSTAEEEGLSAPKLGPGRRNAPRAYRSVQARIRVRGGRPMMQGFANVGAVFGEAQTEDIHPQIIKMARKSGQLNLSNRGMTEVPDKVFHIHEIEADEAKKMTMTMSMDGSDDDRWWEQAELTRLYLASNQLSSLSPKINNLLSLQILDLSDNCLTSLPSTLGELTALQRLNLSHNKLEDLPPGLYGLPDLRSLQLDHNQLKALSDDLANLSLLEYFDVSHNCLTSIPGGIGYLQRLSKFNASHNKIKELPEEIGDCFAMSLLDLNNNEIMELPRSLGNLPKLEQLYLRHNSIQVLPPLHKCSALKELHLGNNFIKELDAEQLGYLRSVSVLDLRDNQISDLPDQITLLQGLERLDITNNDLSTLPCHLGLLPHLKSLLLDGNPMRLIRRDIIQRGTVQLLKYLRSRVSAPINTFPGFENTPLDTGLLQDKAIPDKYQMKSSQTMAYNEKATEIPDKLIENASEAEVRTVDLCKNLLTQLPDKIEQLSRHVFELMLGMNRITSLPTWLGSFHRLQFLDVQGNQLTDLPTDLASCLYLREINLTANRFEQIPACVYEMEQLEILCAADNQINLLYVEGLSKLKRIATLDLHNNNIDFVPPLLGNMTQLRSLQLHGNPFRVPRRAILDKGTREILDYLRTRIVDDQ